MKFRVESQEHSKQIQEALFALGYYWANGTKGTQNTDKPYLFANEYGMVEYSSCELGYLGEYTETTLEELQVMVAGKNSASWCSGEIKELKDVTTSSSIEQNTAIVMLLSGLSDVVKHSQTWNMNQAAAMLSAHVAIIQLIKENQTTKQ